MENSERILNVVEDINIKRYQIPHRLTSVERRLMKYFSKNRSLVACVGNIGAGKSSLVKFLAYNIGMNALFELPDEGFEDHFVEDESFMPLLSTAKESAKRTLAKYYTAINDFISCQANNIIESPQWIVARKNLEREALQIQHSYLDLRRMQIQVASRLQKSTCVDGSALADRYAFCEVLHSDMDVPYITGEALQIIDERLENEFRMLEKPSLLILLHAPVEYLFQNISERQRAEEQDADADGIPEGLARLVKHLNNRYESFIDVLQKSGWYDGPVLSIDVSKIDFVSNVRHLIAVFEGIEHLLIPSESKL